MDSSASPVPSSPPRPMREVIAAFARLSGGWWRGETAPRALRLTLALAALLVVNIGVNVSVNQWNRAFFDALEQRSGSVLATLVLVFLALVVVVAMVGVGIVIARETLQVRWREWLVARLIDGWMGEKRYYRLPLTGHEPVNPEYRIADDSRMATEPVVDFVIGLFHALLTALAFIGVLWHVGGSLTLTVGGASLLIPAYMMLAALLYGAVASWLMLRVGRPLVAALALRNEAEAKLRFELTRLRENAESIAMIGGEPQERARLGQSYLALVGRWLSVVALHGRLTWITNASGALVPVVPLLLATPKYLSGDLSLGAVTQLAAAFVQVQIAIAWLVDNYKQVAVWHASAQRVLALGEAARRLEEGSPMARERIVRHASGDAIALRDLMVRDPSGAVLVREVNLTIRPGERVLVMGESGAGKSTLLRALAGLWNWGAGEAAVPAHWRVAYLPQHPYLPLGSLREALLYPRAEIEIPEERVAEVLLACGLGDLRHRLDAVERWDQLLSRGEIQRLAFARLLLQRPDLVMMDEATSGLDEAAQEHLMGLVLRELPQATLVSIGHRPSLKPFHSRCLVLRKTSGGARLVEEPVSLDLVPARRA